LGAARPCGTPPIGTALNAFLRHRASTIPSVYRQTWDAQWAMENASRSLRSELDLAVDVGRAAAFRAACPVAHARADDYCPRQFVGSGGLRLIAGIRFRNLDRCAPFIEVIEAIRSLASGHEVAGVLGGIATHFGVFAPKWVRLRERLDRAAPLHSTPGVEPGKVTMAAPVGVIVRADVPAREDAAVLPSTVAAVYERYRVAYDEFRQARPRLVRHVRREQPDDLARSERDGALFEIRVNGAWAGVISGWRETEGPLRGFSINEFFLSAPYRGGGLGPAVQRAFARQLPAAPSDALFGTIHPDNRPALQVASRLGRVPLYAQYWVPLD
jgi:hypothetical protein